MTNGSVINYSCTKRAEVYSVRGLKPLNRRIIGSFFMLWQIRTELVDKRIGYHCTRTDCFVKIQLG